MRGSPSRSCSSPPAPRSPANVTLFAGEQSISCSADLVRDNVIGDFNPGFTFNSNGLAILAGSYVCDVDDPDMWLGVTLEQEFPATGARDMGTAIVRVTCDGVEHAFSTTITGAVQRTAFPATRSASASGGEEAMAFADFSDGVVGRTTFTAVD
jgi:hypothetical protein